MDKLAYKLRGCAEIHAPLGLFNAALFVIGLGYGLAFSLGFIAYEFLQDKYKKDESYKDIFGWLIGLGIGAVVIWLLNCLGVDMHMLWR